MKSLILLLAALGSLTLAQPQAFAEPRWTFCAASAQGTRDVWITDVFAAPVAREQLESKLKSVLERKVHTRVDVQCPHPSADKLAAVNAQTRAEEFNRKLGSALHGWPARDSPLKQ